jgi:hypothetical protein
MHLDVQGRRESTAFRGTFRGMESRVVLTGPADPDPAG